jgi:hypothetical protein
MRTIINGSRTVRDYSTVKLAVELSGIRPTQVISGTASGVDRLGAAKKGLRVFVFCCPELGKEDQKCPIS